MVLEYTNSKFFKILMEVKEVVDQNDKEKNEIAAFWDCNPYVISQIGHLEFGLKKISPGGHWIGIAGIACKKAKFPLDKTIFTHTILAITLHDAFIACWDEKYRSERVRPETVINRNIDKFWSPLLQTPPFPEYVSGHSVVSTASAEILSIIFGENFRYRDTTEREYGLKTRKYKSFRQAASEACISRLYGGFITLMQSMKENGKALKLPSIFSKKHKIILISNNSRIKLNNGRFFLRARKTISYMLNF